MQIRIYIDKDKSDEIAFEGNVLTFSFNSPKSYQEARKHLSLTKVYTTELGETITLQEFIGNYSYAKLQKEFQRVKPIVSYLEYEEEIFNWAFPVIINLNFLSFSEKLNILTNPRNNGHNLFFQDEYTLDEYISLEEMIEMYQTILEDCNTIKNNNYSEAEAIYYIYQKYKNRIYQEEGKHERHTKSRSLNQIIKGNKIVCVGYSNYLNAIASILNLNVAALNWAPVDEKDAGHQENIAIINDPKYNIKGIYAIDITLDSKKDENDTEFQNNIHHFLIPLPINEAEKKSYNLINPTSTIYYKIMERLERLKRLKSLNAPEAIIDSEKRLILESINIIYNALDLPLASPDSDIEKEIEKTRDLGRKLIPLKTLENIIIAVSPHKAENIQDIIMTSYHFRFASNETKLLYSIFGSSR